MADGFEASWSSSTDIEAEFADFSYIVSHDLAAVLRHMQAFSALLARDLGEEASERQQQYVARIEDASRDGQAMLDELRTYSRLMRRAIATEVCDTADMVETALQQIDVHARYPGARIVVEDLGAVVTDRALFTEALRRILDNAVKFARPGQAPDIEVRRRCGRDGWLFLVADRGVGVEAGQEEKVFQMFHQQRRETEGIGAGLAIARRALRRVGGDVRLESQAEGACVEIRLPWMAVQS